MKILASIFFICISIADATEVINLKIETIRGDEIEARLHTPKNTNEKLPALIIGPGQGYHMDRPLVKQLAETTVDNNIIVLRFNWNYFTNNGRPSSDLSKEVQDMKAAIDYTRNLPNVDPNKILLAGKSLGTMVAYQSFKNDPTLLSLNLLTPICTWHWDENDNQVEPFAVGESRYPGINLETRPIHMTLGNRDRLCFPYMLFSFLGSSRGNISTAIFGGDHGMNIGKWDDPVFKERNAANIKMAVDTTVHWIKLHLGI